MNKILLSILVLVVSLFADYESGKKIFTNKCSSCHVSHIAMKILKKNFFEKDNKLLNLKAPSINMIVYDIFNGPSQIGDKSDLDMQRIEINEYLKDYLYNPKIENSIVDEEIFKYYDKKKSLKGKVSQDEISNITDYIFEYRKYRKIEHPKKTKILSAKINLNVILEQAKKENKKIMIEAMSKTCHFCKIMEEKVLSKTDVINTLDKNFIFLKVDIDITKLPFGLDKNYKRFTPTFFVIDKNAKLINEYPGSWTKKDFMEILNENK